MKKLNRNLKAIIKIAGGKARMLDVLMQNLPEGFVEKKFKYYECFLGGGTFGLHLLGLDKDLASRTSFCEFNFDLFNVWSTAKTRGEELLNLLSSYQERHSEALFTSVRSKFTSVESVNEKIKSDPDFRLQRAADFIYLNKTCFNGLIRYNKAGKFNSPSGRHEKPAIIDKVNLQKVSEVLNSGVKLVHDDFEEFLRLEMLYGKIDSNTFVYLDPPYIPLSDTSYFAEYTPEGFGIADHERLRDLMRDLNSHGAKVLMSNSDTMLTRYLFKEFTIETILNSRSISAKSGSRGKIKELLIKNY